MPPLEIERKFLLRELPAEYERFEHEEIRQGYAVDGLRFRQRGEAFFRTRKIGTGMVLEEHESEITKAEFDAAWPSTEGRRLEKTRTEVPIANGLVAEVDIFQGTLAGLRYVEVEFDDEKTARAFESPSWFGREVTNDLRHRNSALARLGRPDDWNE